MNKRTQGFSLIGVMVAIDVMVIIAATAIPNPPPPQWFANESNAIATLRTLVRAQARFQKMTCMDEDQDGRGEYGSFGELSGLSNLMRNGVGVPSPLSPPLLPTSFQTIDVQGFASSSGYFFVLFLPTATAAGLPDVSGGGPYAAIAPDMCESFWCAYAWPKTAYTTGKRAFFVNQGGQVLQTQMDVITYSGSMAAPAYSAAFTWPSMASPAAIPPAPSVDGNNWIPAP